MLGEPEHLDKAQLAFFVNLDWQDALAGDPDAMRSLSTHLKTLLGEQDRLRPLPLDGALIAQIRNTVRQASLPRLMYNQLKLSYVDDTTHDLRLDIASGLGSERVLMRKSGKPLSQPVHGLYTRAMFDKISGLGTAELVKQFSQDAWVMGDSAFDVQGTLRLGAQLMDVYADDYIQIWDAIVNDIEIVPMQSLSQAADLMTLLAGSTSPLRGFLTTVEANTNLTKPLENPTAAGAAAAAAGGAAAMAEKALGKLLGSPAKPASTTPTAAARITAHFASLQQLVAGPPGGAPIDRVLAQLAPIAQKMSGVGTGVGETNPLDALAKSGQGEALKALQLQASQLPAPIGPMLASVGGSSESLAVGQARGELDQRYRQQVVKACEEVIAGRYPFSSNSGVDVPLADFGRIFATGGIFDTFFKENLAPLVDTTRSPWAWRSGVSGPVGASANMLRQFEAVERIRQQYFAPGGQLPQQHFTVTAGDLDSAATRFLLELDGQTLDYRHDPVRGVPMTWPGPAPGAAAVTFEDKSGAHPNLTFQGPWAWFRLLDAARFHADTDVRFSAVFQGGGHEGSVLVEASSIRNPFLKPAVRQFRCGG